MKTSILKPFLGGVFLGALMYFAAPIVLLILVLKFIFTPFGMGRMMRYNRFGGGFRGRGMMPAMADRIRSMSDEEYSSFKERFNHNRCHSNFNSNKND